MRRNLIACRRNGDPCAAPSEYDASNGAAMRVLPVALCTLTSDEAAVRSGPRDAPQPGFGCHLRIHCARGTELRAWRSLAPCLSPACWPARIMVWRPFLRAGSRRSILRCAKPVWRRRGRWWPVHRLLIRHAEAVFLQTVTQTLNTRNRHAARLYLEWPCCFSVPRWQCLTLPDPSQRWNL